MKTLRLPFILSLHMIICIEMGKMFIVITYLKNTDLMKELAHFSDFTTEAVIHTCESEEK